MQKNDTPLRLLNSFGRRHGRKLRPAQEKLLREVLPTYLFNLSHWERSKDAQQLSGEGPLLVGEIWLEIGFGAGEHLFQLAQNHPDITFIGAEPFEHGLCSLLHKLQTNPQITNIRIVPDDIRPVLKQLPDGCLERVYILFPDPWPKSRHHKRRLINHALLDDLARLIPEGGILQLATDHVDYSVWMLEHLLTRKDFRWQAESQADWHLPPPEWVTTRYEAKARQEGRLPVYLRFVKQ